MQIQTTIVSISIISIIMLTGCIGQEEQATIISPPNYIVNDIYESRDDNDQIKYVYVEIQNSDTRDLLITVDFVFALLDLDMLGSGYGWGGRTSDGTETIWDDSYHAQQNVLIKAHDIEKIYYTPKSRSDNKIELEWNYTISASFNYKLFS